MPNRQGTSFFGARSISLRSFQASTRYSLPPVDTIPNLTPKVGGGMPRVIFSDRSLHTTGLKKFGNY